MADTIELAHEPTFSIGGLTVFPPLRELVHDDGEREILEHRVMQVLIVLSQAGGAIVTRDELTARCWRGRVVGEDALNRVMSRLRKASDGIGAGSFSIETITKVGYRLIVSEGHGVKSGEATAVPAAGEPPKPMVSRRTFGIGLAAMSISAAGFVILRNNDRGRSPEIEALFAQAWAAWTLGTPESHRQAIGLYRRAIEIDPKSADALGYLGCLYGDRARNASAAERPALYEQAREAGRRSLALESGNVLGRMAIGWAKPTRGNWLAMEETSRTAMNDNPGEQLATFSLAMLLTSVGRLEESAALFAKLDRNPPTATQYRFHTQDLWALGRRDEAERMLAAASSIFGTHWGIWGLRYDMSLDTGQYAAAQSLAHDANGRPQGMTKEQVADYLAIADAAATRVPAKIDSIVAKLSQEARAARWSPSRAISYICYLGRIDAAFELADAFLLSRGAIIPDQPVETTHAPIVSLDERDTRFLFLPLVRPMRDDPRFDRLVTDIGLKKYWRNAGFQPDYSLL